ncbi:hypothetical protein ACEZDB_17430 [Streptacidiphilus sp. N1-3]|uniref:Uncharacterized protein n=1 Tax=Streptacidiphilus alkalitolerans TaxID=3342712 RepID=A0ABV6X3K5_9ACTN
MTAGAACLGLLLGAAGATAAAAPQVSPAPGPGPTACAGVVRITAFAFHPSQVPPGQTSPAVLTVKNCTGVSQTVNETWLGRFSGSSTGAPSACPVLDPFLRPVTIAAHGTNSTSTTYSSPSGCTPAQLAVTVTITSQSGTQLAQQTAVLTFG